MPPPTDLIRVLFLSGAHEQNRRVLDCFADLDPATPLYVISEFEPHRGHWVPYHVFRPYRENRAAVAAALARLRISAAAMVLARGTALGPMRRLALSVASRKLVAYDEALQVFPFTKLPACVVRRALAGLRDDLQPDSRAGKWLRRLVHPREAEIPVRARLASLRGIVAGRFRGSMPETPLRGFEPLSAGVTVVVPSRDGRDLLAAMLPPLLPQIVNGEVIVVDNGSSDGTADWLARDYPEVRVVESARPLSFARAVNAGIALARFSRTLLLNNDMIVEPGFIAAFDSAFDAIPGLYCATAQIFFPPGVRREETGKAVWRRENPLDFPVRCDDPIEGEDLTWVLYGSGGCSLFDTAKLRQLGGVNEVYDPAYVEDMDFGYRAWKHGFPTVFCARARVEHRHRATTARFFTPRQLDFFVERNYLRFLLHAVGDPVLFRALWLDAIRRLQLLAANGSGAALDALRDIPPIAPKSPAASGPLTETEILALGAGDVAAFPGRPARGCSVVLIACPYLPFPLSHGGAVRIFNLMRQAAGARDLVLVAFCDVLAAPPPELLDLCAEVVLVRRHGTHYKRESSRPDVVEEFESEAFRACLKQTASRWKPRVVQLEFTWLAHYAGRYGDARTILVEHDITFDLQRQLLASSIESGAARWELERQTEKWESFETQAWSAVDCVVAMSAKDAAAVSGARSVEMLPNGVDCERFQPSAESPEPRRLLFIGSFRHLPNLLALEFFLRDVWPLLPGYTLHIIAGADPEYYLEYFRSRVSIDLSRSGIELEGFVADVRQAYRRAEIVLAPLTASAGTNIKVLEAMAMGKAVVGTPAGFNGLEVTDGLDVSIAADGATMAERILHCPRPQLEAAARRTALLYDWVAIGERQSMLYDRLDA